MELTARAQSASLPRVTGGEDGLLGEPNGADSSQKASALARAFEWFWRGAALARATGRGNRTGDRAVTWIERAKQSEALARVASTTRDLGGEASACELYRQSAYWALLFLSRETLGAGATHEYSESRWSTLDERWLVPSTRSAEEREALRSQLGMANFVQFAELAPAEQASTCLRLRRLALALLERIAEEQRNYYRVRRQRVVRIAVPVLLACVMLLAAVSRRAAGADLAQGTPWRASSTYSGGGDACSSPQQTCPGSEQGFFFHTEESDRNSWIEFEFDSRPLDISMVEIENRTDCCADRAVPLVIEVSLDHNNWQQVAQRAKSFSTWHASFPSIQASWVRVRLLQKGPLHLKRIRIFK